MELNDKNPLEAFMESNLVDDAEKMKAEEAAAAEAEQEENEQEEQETEEEEETLPEENEEGNEEEEEEEETPDFWEEVKTVTGYEVQVDYGETDPLSVEGVVMREKALIKMAQETYEASIAESFPEAFEVLKHVANGGTLNDLLQVSGDRDYADVTLNKADAATQKLILAEYYTANGNDPATVERLIKLDEESDDGLYERANSVLENLQTKQKKERADKLAKQENLENELKQKDIEAVNAIQSLVSSGKLGDFQIPDADKQGFQAEIGKRIQRDGNGGHVLVTPLNTQNLEQVLQEVFFSFKGGDLEKMVLRKAKSENAKKLRLGVKKENIKGSNKKDANKLPGLEQFIVS